MSFSMRIYWPAELGPAPEELKRYVLMTGLDTQDPAYRLATDCADAVVSTLIERLCFLLEVADFKTELAAAREKEVEALKSRVRKLEWLIDCGVDEDRLGTLLAAYEQECGT